MPDATLDELEFVKLQFPNLIPLVLIESVKGRDYTPEQFYKYQELNKNNPYNLLYVLIDKKRVIKAYLWAQVNTMNDTMYVNTFSIDKSYWGKGEAIQKIIPLVDKLRVQNKCPICYWATTNSKFYKRFGFRESRNKLMEYNEKKT